MLRREDGIDSELLSRLEFESLEQLAVVSIPVVAREVVSNEPAMPCATLALTAVVIGKQL